MNTVLPHPATRAANHLLRSAPLAMERLARHAGRNVAVQVGPATWAFSIQTTGEVTPAPPGGSRDLEVRLSPFLLPRLMLRDEEAAREVEMRGDPQLAAEIAFLARNLDWDVEEDLARIVGDIAAHRIVAVLRGLSQWGRDAAWRTAQGAAEYWTEESPLVASRVKVEDFGRAVAELDAALSALETRVDRLP